MTKLDSFFKETMRLSVMGPCMYFESLSLVYQPCVPTVIMARKAMKDFTFSDGTTIPTGNIIALGASCMQTDPVRIPRVGREELTHEELK